MNDNNSNTNSQILVLGCMIFCVRAILRDPIHCLLACSSPNPVYLIYTRYVHCVLHSQQSYGQCACVYNSMRVFWTVLSKIDNPMAVWALSIFSDAH